MTRNIDENSLSTTTTTMMLLLHFCDLLLKIYAMAMWRHPLEDANPHQFEVQIIGSLKDIDETNVRNLLILTLKS